MNSRGIYRAGPGNDYAFTTFYGNLSISTSDHDDAVSFITPHETARDLLGPNVSFANPADGTVNFSRGSGTSHSYSTAGRYDVIVSIDTGNETCGAIAFQVVSNAPTSTAPSQSSTILYDAANAFRS